MIINFEFYYKYLVKMNRARKTITSYRIGLRQFDSYLVEHSYQAITPENVREYREYMLREKNYTIKTFNNKITILNTYFNFLGKNKLIDSSDLKLKPEKVQNNIDRDYLTNGEYKELVATCVDAETKLLMTFIANTGLRIAEATSLTLNQINPFLIEINNKGKHRMIGIKQELKNELRDFFESKDLDEPMFSYSQTTYRTRLKKAAALAGVDPDKVFPHAFRHYYAKEFLRTRTEGNALVMLQRILGHSDIKTTMIYLDYTNKEVVEAMVS